jgi:hypothetical protein
MAGSLHLPLYSSSSVKTDYLVHVSLSFHTSFLQLKAIVFHGLFLPWKIYTS